MNTFWSSLGYLSFSPLLPWATLGPILVIFGILTVFFSFFAFKNRASGSFLRLFVTLLLGVMLSNPAHISEIHTPTDDTALVLVDRSPSQSIGDRKKQTDDAIATLSALLSAQPHLKFRIREIGKETDTETKILPALKQALADVPKDQRAGVILITDGQLHDDMSEASLSSLPKETPLHVLLTGHKQESDRRIKIISAPSFGLVGQKAMAKIKIEEPSSSQSKGSLVALTLTFENDPPQVMTVPIGEDIEIPLSITHGGPNVVGLDVEEAPQELTLTNNHAALVVGGVQERLRVMMISSTPHNGERTWRNTLKSDPSVDLVHFTILRTKTSLDSATESEMSLIPFPIDELFNIKLKDFDLVIIDRYNDPSLIPSQYLRKLNDFVENGGALLDASGADLNDKGGLAKTVVAKILPSVPLIQAPLMGAFQPQISDAGLRHPVTQDLSSLLPPNWGPWYRQASVSPSSEAQVLMTGLNNAPLLLLSEEGKGRVAQLTSEQIWLWTRGHKGGGPSEPLVRNLIHWLLKEPDLEASRLFGRIEGQKLLITRHSPTPQPENLVTITTPEGKTQNLNLKDNGRSETAEMEVQTPGLYRLSDYKNTAFAIMGEAHAPEQTEMKASADKVAPLLSKTDAGLVWLDTLETHQLTLKRVSSTASASGAFWFGLRQNETYSISGLTHTPLLPWAIGLALLTLGFLGAWYREGK